MTNKYASNSLYTECGIRNPVAIDDLVNVYGLTNHSTIKVDNLYSVNSATWGTVVSITDVCFYDRDRNKFFVKGQYSDNDNSNSWFTLQELSTKLGVSPTRKYAEVFSTQTGNSLLNVWKFTDSNNVTWYLDKNGSGTWITSDSFVNCTASDTAKPLCFTNVNEGASTITLTLSGTLTVNLLYSTDCYNWLTYTVGDTLTLSDKGDSVYFKGSITGSKSTANYVQFVMTGLISASGNTNSLISSTNFSSITSLSNTYEFYSLFKGCASLVNAPLLPATGITTGCYSVMFNSCTSLVNAPVLPATTLAASCYASMFVGCTSLTKPPDLPATYTINRCYYSMFNGCTSLNRPPKISAITAAVFSYAYMFYNCSSLSSAPELHATNASASCYISMFSGCTKLINIPKTLPATTLADTCYGGMFMNCSSIQRAPNLPATTLVSSCYQNMFSGCTSLKSVRCSATSISATNCLSTWLNNVSPTGVVYTEDNVDFPTQSSSGIPDGWKQSMSNTWEYYTGVFSSSDIDLSANTDNSVYKVYNTQLLELGSRYKSLYDSSTGPNCFVIQQLLDSSNNVIPHIDSNDNALVWFSGMTADGSPKISGTLSTPVIKIKFKVKIDDLRYF